MAHTYCVIVYYNDEPLIRIFNEPRLGMFNSTNIKNLIEKK